jgi:hypothetical protein
MWLSINVPGHNRPDEKDGSEVFASTLAMSPSSPRIVQSLQQYTPNKSACIGTKGEEAGRSRIYKISEEKPLYAS